MTSEEAFTFLLDEITKKKVELQNVGTQLFVAGHHEKIRPITQQIEDIGQLIRELINIRKHWALILHGQKIEDNPPKDLINVKLKRRIQSKPIIQNNNFLTRMVISPEEAMGYLRAINHPLCQSAIKSNWIVNNSGFVKAQSVLWLFCWAKTGLNSTDAGLAAQKAMMKIFGKSFEWFDSRIPHEFARHNRRAPYNIETELEKKLSR